MSRLARRRRSFLVVMAAFILLPACLVAAMTAAQAQGPGPYPPARQFRPDGVVNSSPATTALTDIGTAAFVLGVDGAVWWATPSAGWSSLGMPTVGPAQTPLGIVGTPAVVSWGPRRIDLFVEGGDHKLWQRFSTCSGCGWSPWIQPVGTDGVLASPPAVTSWGGGRIDVVVVGTDGHLWQRDWNDTAWSPGWQGIGAPAAVRPKANPALAGSYYPPAITTYTPGRLDIFIWGGDNALWQTYLSDNRWHGWIQPPGTATGVLNSAPAAEWWNGGGQNNATVFVQGVDGHLYQTTYGGGSAWRGWAMEGAPENVFKSAPETDTTLQAQPYVLVWGTDNKAYQYVMVNPVVSRVAAAVQFSASRAGFSSFTLVDTVAQATYSSPGANTQIRTASAIKVPIAMTLIRDVDSQHRGLTATESANLNHMITQSDNNAATALWNEVGGSSAVVGLMNNFGATNTAPDPGSPGAWGFTLSTSHDLAAVLARLAEGPFPASNTIVDLMHQVIPSQAWGIGAAVPGAAIKNGWFPDPTEWRVNCLGIIGGNRYALAVMTKYPIGLGQGYGEATCQGIAADLFPSSANNAHPAVPQAAVSVPTITGVGMTADGG